MAIKHSTTANPNDIVASADWNANHVVDGNTGEVLFLIAGGNVSTDSGLFWDNTNKRLGVGTNTPSEKLEINGNILSANFSTSDNHTYAGDLAGSGNTGGETTLVGYRAGVDNPNDYLTAFGAWAGDTSTGEDNVFVGYSVGYANTGHDNTFIGDASGSDNIGDFNVFLGSGAGVSNQASSSIGLGYRALLSNTGNNVVAIGYEAGKLNATANQFIVKHGLVNAIPLIQGDFSTGNVAIGKASAGSKLGVAGLPIFANNAAAIVGGLAAGDFYRTGADPDPLMVVH